MARSAVMFDLDGTLADTLADIAAAGNAMLAALGRAARPINDYRTLAGQGVEYLVDHALGGGTDAETVSRGAAMVRDYYAAHGHALTRPYPGVPELLDALVERGVTLAVLTNKPHDAAEKLLQTLYSRWDFAAIRGAVPGEALKPDPAAALAIVRELGVGPGSWLYLGDTAVDMVTGKAAGFFTVGATWGFRDERELRESGADAIVHEPLDVLALL